MGILTGILVDDKLREIAAPYLSDGKTILEVAAGDNPGPFYALYPLVHPNGRYVVADPITNADYFKQVARSYFRRAVYDGLVDDSFPLHAANLQFPPVSGQDSSIPKGLDFILFYNVMSFLVFDSREMKPILANLSKKKNPGCRVLIYDAPYHIAELCYGKGYSKYLKNMLGCEANDTTEDRHAYLLAEL